SRGTRAGRHRGPVGVGGGHPERAHPGDRRVRGGARAAGRIPGRTARRLRQRPPRRRWRPSGDHGGQAPGPGRELGPVGHRRRELAKGADHIRSLVRPECDTAPDCRFDPPLPPFHGAAFPFIASNVIPSPDAAPTFPFAIHRVGGVRVGVVAVTLPPENAPETTTRLSDPLRAVEETVESLEFLGVDAIVGVAQSTTVHSNLDPGACPDELTELDVVEELDPRVDALIVGASGGPATCRVWDSDNDERMVVAPASHGRSVTVVDLTVDTETGDVVRPQTSAF